MAECYSKAKLKSTSRATSNQINCYHTRQLSGAYVTNGNQLLKQGIRSSEGLLAIKSKSHACNGPSDMICHRR